MKPTIDEIGRLAIKAHIARRMFNYAVQLAEETKLEAAPYSYEKERLALEAEAEFSKAADTFLGFTLEAE